MQFTLGSRKILGNPHSENRETLDYKRDLHRPKTQKAFAARQAIPWTTFRNWLYDRRKAKPEQRSAPGFQEIRIAPMEWASRWAVEINLDGRTVVRLQAGTDPQWVRAIIQPLRRLC